ncbi:hypothetical protein SEPCBS119000_006003 [Sporothrix epigloea]|uniref:Ankyrin repeat protein n=1 Tax=Sporothrix epigloea TaxID=1892477 RepID=A0ABP0E4N4_9PEZI
MTESLVSPAKIGPHKKHLDAHGQTFLARACARGEFELAKQRLEERPEDLNVADFAGNTPLQIAALNGYGNIVKLLIDAGCNLECVNHDKDTPLLDAVDNGHLEVVKLLLDAGVNPRKANLNGVEPLERVTDDIDNAVEIRLALVEAKKKIGERRFTSEEHRHENEETRSLYNPDSPRRSPAPPSASSRRAATGRATKTSNHLLYMPMDDKTLRLAAGRGDQQEVIRILQVRETFDDPEAMVAASRGGHDVVLQLLLALGKANPDPPPISSAPPEHATPILAAIGQENIKVVRLLLEQSAFDPCKRFEGSTYYELARQRQGPNWKEEEDILKKAYDHYKKTHGGKTKQHTRKDADSRHLSRTVEADNETSIRAHKRKPTSPSDERSRKKTIIVKTNTAHAASDSSTARHEDKGSHKRSSDHSNGKLSAKPRQRTDRSPSVSNHDAPPPKTNSRNFDSDSIAFSSEGEAAKPRRKKLVSGRELKDEKIREQERVREKQRRASIISSTDITPPKQPSSPSDLRSDDTVADKDKMRAEKPRDGERDRARQPKKERVKYAASEITGTRGRLSETPPHSSVSDEDTSEAPVKRRRRPEADYESDNGKRPSKGSAPPDNQPMKVTTSATYDLPTIKVVSKRRDDEDRRSAFDVKTKKQEPSLDRGRKDSQQLSVPPAEKTIHVKTESSDVEMVDVRLKQRASSNASASASVTSAESEAHRRRDGEKKRKKSDTLSHDSAAEAKKTEDGVQRRHRQEEEDEKRLKEERRKKERKRQEEEEAVRIRDEEKLKQRKKLEDEEKKKRQEEEEKQRQEAAKQKRKFEEEQRKMREEKEQLRQERLEKEAAEKARRKIEDDERQQRELEEQRRILAEKQAEEVRRRQLEEKERIRISRLPPLLQWLSTCPDPKFPSIAQLFKSLHSVRYDCINTDATGTAEGREGWLLNTQVALLLGEKDLGLTRFSSWQRLPASSIAKEVIWRVEADRYAMTDPDVYHLGRQLAGLYGGQDPRKMSTPDMCKLRNATRDKFLSTDMFFVKASDVMSVVPQFPHLRGIRLALMYRELPENEMQLKTVACTTKWKIDPDAAQLYGFAPGPKYYVDGLFVGQQRTGLTIPSRTPPEVRVPRRGLVCVPYDDPEFTSMCKDMGLDPFTLSGYASFIAKHRTGSSPSPEAAPNNTHDLTATASPASVNGSYDIQTARPSSPHSTQRTQEAVHINGVKGVNGVNGHSSLNGLHETSST